MSAKIFCKTGQLAGASYEIQEEATIGKSVENTIQLFPGLISAKHARIFFDKKTNCYYLEDIGSRNGTRLDGMRVTTKEKLHSLNIITFAEKFDFIFQVTTAGLKEDPVKKTPIPAAQPLVGKNTKPVPEKLQQKEPTSAPKTVIEDGGFGPIPAFAPITEKRDEEGKRRTIMGENNIAIPKIPVPPPLQEEKTKPAVVGMKTVLDNNAPMMAPLIIQDDKKSLPVPAMPSAIEKTVVSSIPIYTLECSNVKGKRVSFPLKEGENTIGRIPTCDVPIDDASLSRNHAIIIVNAGKVMLKDLGSKNYTTLNDVKVTSDIEIIPECSISFGVVKATLRRVS